MPDKKPLTVKQSKRKAHTRTIKMKPITFTCEECNEEVTEEVYPGPTPKYCNHCRREVRRRKDRERQRRYRAHKKK